MHACCEGAELGYELESVVLLGSCYYCKLLFGDRDCVSNYSPDCLAYSWNSQNVPGINVYFLGLPRWLTGTARVSSSSDHWLKVLTAVSAGGISLLFGAATLWASGGKIKKQRPVWGAER